MREKKIQIFFLHETQKKVEHAQYIFLIRYIISQKIANKNIILIKNHNQWLFTFYQF